MKNDMKGIAKENPFAVDSFETTDDEELQEACSRVELENSRDKRKDKKKSKRRTEPDPSQLSLDLDS